MNQEVAWLLLFVVLGATDARSFPVIKRSQRKRRIKNGRDEEERFATITITITTITITTISNSVVVIVAVRGTLDSLARTRSGILK